MSDEMTGVIVGVFIALPVSRLAHQVGYWIAQVEWHRFISAMLYILLDA